MELEVKPSDARLGRLDVSFSPRRLCEWRNCRGWAAVMSDLLVGVGKADQLRFGPGASEELKT
jgi:hypothetical protein